MFKAFFEVSKLSELLECGWCTHVHMVGGQVVLQVKFDFARSWLLKCLRLKIAHVYQGSVCSFFVTQRDCSWDGSSRFNSQLDVGHSIVLVKHLVKRYESLSSVIVLLFNHLPDVLPLILLSFDFLVCLITVFSELHT